MKFYSITLSVLIPLILMSSLTPSVHARVLWYGDPNKSVKSNFRRLDTTGNKNTRTCSDRNKKPSVSTPRDGRYGKVWKITKPKGRQRAEFARTKYIPKDGQLLYYGWRWKINASPNIKKGVAVWQWKTDDKGRKNNNKQNYPLNLGYDGKKLSLSAYGPGNPNWTQGSSINNRRTVIWERSVGENKWVNLALAIKLSKNKNKGYVEFWFNGKKQTLKNSQSKQYKVKLSKDRKRAYHRTMDGSEMYPKWGSYNQNACLYNITTYYDEMRIGTKLSDVRPR